MLVGYVEIVADGTLDCIYGDIVLLFRHKAAGYLLRQGHGDVFVGQGGVGDEGDETTFEFPEVGLDPGGQEFENIFRDVDSFPEAPRLEHGEPGVVVRLAELYRKPPLEAGKQSFLKVLQVYRGSV